MKKNKSESLLIDGRMMFMSGIGRVIRCVLPVLLNRFGWNRATIIIFPGDREAAFLWAKNCQIDKFITWRYSSLQIYSPLIGLWPDGFLNNHAADVVWFPHYPHPILRSVGLPCVITVPDCCHIAPHEARLPLVKRWVARWFLRRARMAPVLVFYGAHAEAEFRHLVGDPVGSIGRMPCGVDSEWFDMEVGGVTGGKKQNDTPYLVFVGNLKPHKNLHRLIVAMRKLWSIKFPFDLKVIGKINGFSNGISGIDLDYGGRQRVYLLGELNDVEMRQVIKGARAMIFPSLYEGFGLPPLEAMAAGVAVICSDIPPLREVCDDAAIYFDPMSVDSIAAAVEIGLSNAHAESERIVLGRQRASQYTWERCADGLDKALRMAIVLRGENAR